MSVYLKIDVGYHRAGIPNENWSQIQKVAKVLAENSGIGLLAINF